MNDLLLMKPVSPPSIYSTTFLLNSFILIVSSF